ncbi:unnamed protein product [Leptidea sinapis]|uniref:RING-type domain-containing protein n=1 Tax=Leptidea sinapis TaxID=189913 RepID=A0A5E4QTR5_9NEOP|nr:unnamed protein product [Leptidea sinapis]
MLRTDDGYTALHLAALNNHAEIAELLVAGGARPDLQNANLQTALHLAVERQHTQIVRLLIANGADLNICDKQLRRLQEVTDFPSLGGIANTHDKKSSASIACFLAAHGADLNTLTSYRKDGEGAASDGTPDSDGGSLGATAATPVASPEVGTCNLAGVVKRTDPTMEECLVCSDAKRDTLFKPCGHICCCNVCASRVKKCLECRSCVVSRARVRECVVCSEAAATVVFRPCGDVCACAGCAPLMRKCVECRSPLSPHHAIHNIDRQYTTWRCYTNLAMVQVNKGQPAPAQAAPHLMNNGIRSGNTGPAPVGPAPVAPAAVAPPPGAPGPAPAAAASAAPPQMCGDCITVCPICRKQVEKRILLY